VDPRTYLEVAHDLAGMGGTGHLRSAVSRAYYAVFHAASEASRRLGASSTHSHDAIGDRFQTSDDPEISAIGQRFLSLKSARHRADYKLRPPADVEDAEIVAVTLSEARELFDVFQSLPVGARRGAAERAVRAYENRVRGPGPG
jgi:uncharacterized protein (UPF0332 family)